MEIQNKTIEEYMINVEKNRKALQIKYENINKKYESINLELVNSLSCKEKLNLINKNQEKFLSEEKN